MLKRRARGTPMHRAYHIIAIIEWIVFAGDVIRGRHLRQHIEYLYQLCVRIVYAVLGIL